MKKLENTSLWSNVWKGLKSPKSLFVSKILKWQWSRRQRRRTTVGICRAARAAKMDIFRDIYISPANILYCIFVRLPYGNLFWDWHNFLTPRPEAGCFISSPFHHLYSQLFQFHKFWKVLKNSWLLYLPLKIILSFKILDIVVAKIFLVAIFGTHNNFFKF